MLANEVTYSDFTVIWEPEVGGDVFTSHVKLRDDPESWDEGHVISALVEVEEERNTCGIIAVLRGKSRSYWGCAINEG